jgi:hypothetical protein
MVDVVREENQDRESFLDGYLKFMREKWTKVPPYQLEEACSHVRIWRYAFLFIFFPLYILPISCQRSITTARGGL